MAVAETPGKTKHFQTIVLDDSTILCDCPGLVFPTLSGSKAELVVSGILRIDEMRDAIGAAIQLLRSSTVRALFSATFRSAKLSTLSCVPFSLCTGPVQLVCNRIPRTVMEHQYGINLPIGIDDDPYAPPKAHTVM